MRYRGRLQDWNDDKGFGFVTPAKLDERVFVHARAFTARPRRPMNGDLIDFDLEHDPQGRPRATQVRFAGASVPASQLPPLRTGTATGFKARAWAVAFAGLVVGAALLGQVHAAVPLVYLVTSCLTFIVYAYDKSAAMGGRWRTSEQTLLVLGLAGGWPGAVFAQHMFRHKSRKASFQLAFWLSVGLNCTVLAALFTAPGRGVLVELLRAL